MRTRNMPWKKKHETIQCPDVWNEWKKNITRFYAVLWFYLSIYFFLFGFFAADFYISNGWTLEH